MLKGFQLNNLIKKIKALVLSEVSISSILTKLYPIFKGFKLTMPYVKPGFKLYRLRIVNSKPKNISEVGMPPKKLINRYGRLNGIGEQMFYSSMSRRSTYFELGVKKDDFCVLSRWKSIDKLLLIHIGFSEDYHERLNSGRTNNNHPFTKISRKFSARDRMIYDFISNEFIRKAKEGYEYKISIALAKKMLYNGPQDGIIYPSISAFGNIDNVAIKPDRINKIQLKSIEYVKVKNRENTQCEIDVIDSSTNFDEDGTINWNGRKLQWELRNKGDTGNAKVIDSEWVLFDDNGNEIDPV